MYKRILCIVLLLLFLAGCTSRTEGPVLPSREVILPTIDPAMAQRYGSDSEAPIPSDPYKGGDAQPDETDPDRPDASDPQPTSPSPSETRPGNTDPSNPQPTSPSPSETRPGSTDPSEPKPTSPTPSETRPGSTDPSEPKPTSPAPTETQPTIITPPTEPPATQPAPTEPPETKPTEPPETKPTEPPATEPAPSEPPVTSPATGIPEEPDDEPPAEDLQILSVGPYSGPFYEDGTDEQVERVASLLVMNPDKRILQYGELYLTINGAEAVFQISDLPPGGTVLVLEAHRMQIYPDPDVKLLTGKCVLTYRDIEAEQEHPELSFRSTGGNLTVTNNGKLTINSLDVSYKLRRDVDSYLGGIAYHVHFGKLAPGESRTVTAGHYDPETCEIVAIKVQ